MICTECSNRRCPTCESVSCACGHDGSTVRPLTHFERTLRVNGLALPIVLPADQAEVGA